MSLIANFLLVLAHWITWVATANPLVRIVVGLPLYLFTAVALVALPVGLMVWFLPLTLLSMLSGKSGRDPRVKRFADPAVAELVARITLLAIYQVDQILTMELSEGEGEIPPTPPPDPSSLNG